MKTKFDFALQYLPLFFVIALSLLFRFYRVLDFQFWSSDEEIIAHFVRKIVEDRRLFLISPNFSLGISLGSGFYMVSGILYGLVRLNPITALQIGTMLGVVTTLLIYKIGKEMRNTRLGIFAGFLYACSFLASLNDRRWWTLTTVPFFTSLCILALMQIMKKKYGYFTLLAFSITSAWQIDPNLGILPILAGIVYIIYKIPLLHAKYRWGWILIIISLLPLIFFEIRHPGSLTHPLTEKIGQYRSQTIPINEIISSFFEYGIRIPTIYAQYIAVYPNKKMDALFNWIYDPKIVLSPLPQIFILFLFALTLVWVWQNRKNNSFTKQSVVLLWLFFCTFLVVLFICRLIFKLPWRPYYFHVSTPILFLLLAFGIDILYQKKKTVALFLVGAFMIINWWTLVYSDFEYPLKDKQQLVETILKQIGTQPFTLRTVARNNLKYSGFTGLFVLNHGTLLSSDEYVALDWWFRAHSLYFVNPDQKQFTYSVFIAPASSLLPVRQEIFSTQEGSLYASIININKK